SRGVSRMNSLASLAGQETIRRRAALSAASTSPSTAATKKPSTVAWMVTTRPCIRMGMMETANAHAELVSQTWPNSMSGSSSPAANAPGQHTHQDSEDQCHVEVHQRRQPKVGCAVLSEVADLLRPECQIAQADQGHQRRILEVLNGQVAECWHHLGN